VKTHGISNAIPGPAFGLLLVVYALGIWRMRRRALPIADAYAAYVILNLSLSFATPDQGAAVARLHDRVHRRGHWSFYGSSVLLHRSGSPSRGRRHRVEKPSRFGQMANGLQKSRPVQQLGHFECPLCNPPTKLILADAQAAFALGRGQAREGAGSLSVCMSLPLRPKTAAPFLEIDELRCLAEGGCHTESDIVDGKRADT
jgi:hypothetical protein